MVITVRNGHPSRRPLARNNIDGLPAGPSGVAVRTRVGRPLAPGRSDQVPAAEGTGPASGAAWSCPPGRPARVPFAELTTVRPTVRAAPGAPAHLAPILAQLLTGATDVTASQRLGMSPRTFSRRVSELLDYLGVMSRFQAGVAAVNRGWVVSVDPADPNEHAAS
ncbi:MAG TPA: hypothetical protein VGD43_05925 [Micromonospora sp.]